MPNEVKVYTCEHTTEQSAGICLACLATAVADIQAKVNAIHGVFEALAPMVQKMPPGMIPPGMFGPRR